MLSCTASLAGLLERGQSPTSSLTPQRLRRSKVTMMVAASLLVLVVMCVALGFAFGGPQRDDLLDFRLRQPTVAQDVMGNFDAVNNSVAVVWFGDADRLTVGGVTAEAHRAHPKRALDVETVRLLKLHGRGVLEKDESGRSSARA